MTDKVKKSTENYLLVYPKQVKEDIGRAVNTMGFIDKEIPDEDLLTINKDLGDIDSELKSLETSIQDIRSKNKDVVDNLSNSLEYYEKSDELVAKMAKGDKYLYLSGWVPDSKINDFKNLSNKYDDTIVTVKEESNQEPPTKLKNNKLFKPFEFLVNMYGAPNYNEIDPTPFFAVSYMLLYGMMFGDLGQGLVFVLLSFLVDKKNKTFGALIRRVGFSACFFGLMYGSVFGIETLIPAILIKPFDNIMKVLIASVAFGIGLLVISYFIGIYNKLVKQKNIEEGIFGKEGIAGLMMMTSFVLLILNIVKVNPLPKTVGLVILLASIVMIVFSRPIAAKIEKRDEVFESSAFDYYVESSFSIIEALLSVFSNLVSFTRVGAFAINHVGLYMAFEVMSKIAGGGIKGLIILILGNILIIGLEGMIVFIQGLRLEFYEMFSKYYQGNGRKFRPIKESK
ncbi:V-type ATP synthase subunit I [Anaerococcus degeneri]|uniref:H(+)-transporting ATPase n=1 Tax=Anaerococcus degeneri TaxID=361500 RepID=A0ABS7YUF6_9FIRM|nr:V-type ATPase 116kDa subunit family protein [Anaerococcus degeneri]MBP2015103.1 V/A-type H+-transporting ATPase subunit I [Anaerococcus degeneri]MCA2095363.1 H(+)-transporting ATPase [Anaerococcus degeneri]